ncbi:tripartite tricarboxylate transporter TctB family protein [Bacillus sp. Marseille-P3661]|uniref:tripartite tricarboxylate transporter TctB family protein n=1 Tax=Bacillus sp. Marseille-P3661 TaxID=1936234 RepID=UPI000C81BFAB|nr:tripartite tricarboxylate transporter TctB family protein [Bacillus sp. Marseille-P3661]
MKTKVSNSFDVFLFIIFLAMTCISFQYNSSARLMPFIFGTIGSFMLLIQLIFNFVPSTQKLLKFINPKQYPNQDSINEKESSDNYSNEWKQSLIGLAALCCFILLFQLLGYLLAVPIFILLFMKIAFKESWRMSIVTSLITWVFVWLLFDVLLAFQG